MIKEPPFPLSLMPTERTALEWIKAGKEPTRTALEAIVSRRWAKWVKGTVLSHTPPLRHVASMAHAVPQERQR
jgi:hypothetical protein